MGSAREDMGSAREDMGSAREDMGSGGRRFLLHTFNIALSNMCWMGSGILRISFVLMVSITGLSTMRELLQSCSIEPDTTRGLS